MFSSIVNKVTVEIFTAALAVLAYGPGDPLLMGEVYDIRGDDAAWVQEIGEYPIDDFAWLLLVENQSHADGKVALADVRDLGELEKALEAVIYWEAALSQNQFYWDNHPHFDRLKTIEHADKAQKALLILRDQQRLLEKFSSFRERLERRREELGGRR